MLTAAITDFSFHRIEMAFGFTGAGAPAWHGRPRNGLPGHGAGLSCSGTDRTRKPEVSRLLASVAV